MWATLSQLAGVPSGSCPPESGRAWSSLQLTTSVATLVLSSGLHSSIAAPLESYADQHLVDNPSAVPALIAKLKGYVRSSTRTDAREVHISGSPAYSFLNEFSEWIHHGGSSELGWPPFGHERDACLGFPSGAS
jgi:hypothetical protein